MAWKICAVCGYPLVRRTPDGVFLHARPDWADHVVVPVDVGEVPMNQRCDFCDAQPVEWILMTDPFVMTDGISRSVAQWAACEPCGQLIKKDQWGRVVTRVKQHGPPVSRRATRRELTELYALVQRNMHGVIPSREWLPEEAFPQVDE